MFQNDDGPPTKREKAVIFDLDGTLVYNSEYPVVGCGIHPVEVMVNGQPVYIHVRPRVVTAMRMCWGCYKIAIWSAGEAAYVTSVVESVLLPHIRAEIPEFSFDAVYTRADLEKTRYKALEYACALLECKGAILVDDLEGNCQGAIDDGFSAHQVPEFAPVDDVDVSRVDYELALVFLHPFFTWGTPPQRYEGPVA